MKSVQFHEAFSSQSSVLLLVRASAVTHVAFGVFFFFSYKEGITLSDFASTELYRSEEARGRTKSSWRILKRAQDWAACRSSPNSQCLGVPGTALPVSMGQAAMPTSLYFRVCTICLESRAERLARCGRETETAAMFTCTEDSASCLNLPAFTKIEWKTSQLCFYSSSHYQSSYGELKRSSMGVVLSHFQFCATSAVSTLWTHHLMTVVNICFIKAESLCGLNLLGLRGEHKARAAGRFEGTLWSFWPLAGPWSTF